MSQGQVTAMLCWAWTRIRTESGLLAAATPRTRPSASGHQQQHEASLLVSTSEIAQVLNPV